MSEVLAGQREREKVAPFTAAYFGSLRNRSCINKEYPQSPTTIPIAIPFHLQLCTAFPSLYTSLFLFSPTVPPRRLKLSRRVSSFYPPDASPPPRSQKQWGSQSHLLFSGSIVRVEPTSCSLLHLSQVRENGSRSRILLHFYKAT